MSADILTDELPLAEASEVRDSNRRRRYGAVDTLRREVKTGELPSTMREGKYIVSRPALDAMVEQKASERAFAELKAAAVERAKLAPPITADRADVIISILRGAA